MQLVQKAAVKWTEELPIDQRAVRRAIEETRETYLKTIREHQWEILAKASYSREALNDEEHLRLLLNRCLLEYRYYDENENLRIWWNVHPLIEGIPRFEAELELFKVRSR